MLHLIEAVGRSFVLGFLRKEARLRRAVNPQGSG
jgi:hypothetical protein